MQKQVTQVQTSVREASIPDPADLDMDYGCEEPDLCFSRSQVRDPAYALLDSGATHVLLPGHMLPKGARSFEVTVNLRRRTNVQQLTCKIDLSNSFYYLFFSFVLLELKPFVLKGKVLGETL